MLDKLGGVWAPRPSTGPHKLRECLPLVVMLRNRLNYALTGHEVKMICLNRHIKVDGKIRTDPGFPAGFMDVISIQESGDLFRLLFDVKGRFTLHRINEKEAQYKLCRVRSVAVTKKKIPYLVTHDGRTIRYPDPNVKVNDTIRVSIETGKITAHYPFAAGNMCMITKGKNQGRVGTIVHRERHPGSFDIVHVQDGADHKFATRLSNVFVIGEGSTPQISLPKGKGIKLSIIEESAIRLASK